MSALVHKGKKVAETVDTPVQGILTQAEFDALPVEQQNNGLYVIDDGQSGGSGSSSGSNGTTFTPSVSPEGVISWTNDGGLANPEPVNIKGPQGEQGTQGSDGQNATVNGQNVMTITAEAPVMLAQNGDTLTISAQGLSTAEMHRMIFRGKNLGGALTAAQKTAIQNGTFEDLYLGDYWVINGVNWRIVDFDYWWNCGNAAFTKHHLVIMPDTNLGANKQMNATNTTEGGYVGSAMYTTNMADAKAMCTAAFGSNILTHREFLVNAVANGKPSAGAWLDSTIELPNECMIYGHPHFTPACDGTTVPTFYTIDKTQLALFAAVPKFITTRQNYWLRDVVSSAYFAGVNCDGDTSYYGASLTYIGVRPVFPVGVA